MEQVWGGNGDQVQPEKFMVKCEKPIYTSRWEVIRFATLD